MKKTSIFPSNYRIGWLAAMFAVHSDYDSFSLEKDGVLLNSGKSQQRISYLSIGKGIALEPGFFWDALAIHLENGEITRIGGIRKKQSQRLQVGLNQTARRYLSEFFQRMVPEIQAASRQAHVLFPGNRYIRKTVARQWLQTYDDLAKGIQRKDMQCFLPANIIQDLEFIRPLMNHGYDTIERLNESYVARQIEAFKDFFDGVESNPLTANQRRACVIDEQHNLVLAGAGTGKTSTMIGRAGYLIKEVAPNV